MNNEKKQKYKEKLLNERNQKKTLIQSFKENELSSLNNEMASELSLYDNHPSDIATELYDVEKAMALKAEQEKILGEIEAALESVDEGVYGNCHLCGREIAEERLEELPYTDLCVSCAKEKMKVESVKNRPVEESVLGTPFISEKRDDNVGFDLEDSYQKVEAFNSIKDTEEFDSSDEQYVESIERISNEQYRNQL